MSYDMRVRAPAKINVGLRVLPVREDGYHGIESVFQRVPLYDILQVRRTGSPGSRCTVLCDGMVLPDENTLTAAFDAFCAVAGVAGSVDVHLEKHIPAGAGLGGGSSDAAALVRALEGIHKVSLSGGDRRRIASLVGSDVFFFLDSDAMREGCAVVSGRGEVVRAFPARRDLFFVLVCPEVHSSTEEAYRLVDDHCSPGWSWAGPGLDSLEREYGLDAGEWRFVNSFAEPLVARFPPIGQALQDLRDAGAAYAQMSGSGSAVFGVFGSVARADDAAFVLRKKWKRCYSLAST